ncbi:MAG: hypothetical protein EOP49_13125 [Sphingobacteriales bacterium]|nr:MAG: hypothetical protein EOP49_13125 [Sphingobacteriales bacterium]
MDLKRLIFFLIVFAAAGPLAFAQSGKDSNGRKRQPVRVIKDLYKDAYKSIQRDPTDTVDPNKVMVARSEELFSRFEGKIIRHIVVKQFGFERTFADTSTRIGYFGTRVLNALHTDTRDWIIKQNLFIRENVPLNAAKLADNERYLRTLDFIQDARIFVYGTAGDSVDILVITKDLFSLTGVVDASTTSAKVRLAEANFFGMAQRIQVTGLWEQNRQPATGYEILYSKSNIGGSFVNGTIAVTQINTGRSEGTEDEAAFYLKLDRPLVSPFSHAAGGIEVSFNQSNNYFNRPAGDFLNYRYNVYDGWAGYNIGTRGLAEGQNYSNNRNRIFVSARYLQTDYLTTPAHVGDGLDAVYNSRRMVLGQLSFFRQDFYKLNYIYGFGTTEDVPTGYNVSITGGWTKQLSLERPYAGFQAEQFIITPNGGFIDAVFKAGGYYRNKRMEDAGTLASISLFTKLLRVRNWKSREFIALSISQLKNRMTYEPLRINNPYGLYEFSTDSVQGTRRISLYTESILYTNKKVLGFRFAPFTSLGASLISPENLPFRKSDIYTGIGAGVRTRNENLIFGTIELHAIYFPRAVYSVGNYRINLRSDIWFRYRTRFVQAPDIIQMNRGTL